MNIGDKVVTTQIVKKGAQPDGSSIPYVENLKNPIEGVLVGRTSACSGGNGKPPKKEFDCYEIAIDLTHKIKAPLGAVQPVVVVAPVIAATVAQQPGANFVNNSSAPQSNRVPISSDEVRKLVVSAVGAKLDAKEPFTAFNITQSLRTANPFKNIMHNEVREIVHEIANNRLLFGGFLFQDVEPTSGAILYQIA